jgi:hypothetical protein
MNIRSFLTFCLTFKILGWSLPNDMQAIVSVNIRYKFLSNRKTYRMSGYITKSIFLLLMSSFA